MARHIWVYLAASLIFSGTIWTGHYRGGPTGMSASAATGPSISAVPGVVYVGDSFPIVGSGFTPGSVVNFFVATGDGAANYGPLIPTNVLPDSLTVYLPITISQGEGVASVEVVNTDEGHVSSNSVLTLLQGDPAFGFPNIIAIDGIGLSPTSVEPGVALANVETVVAAGQSVTLSGSGFDTVNGVGIDLFCACPGSKVGPFFLLPGQSGLSADSLTFTLPSGTSGPATGPGSIQVTNLGSMLKSAGVSVPVGATISLDSVVQSGSTITLNGTGFSTLSVINLFNLQDGTVVNLGGLTSAGTPLIPLSLVSDVKMTFTLPTSAVTGPAYVQVLNPPFIGFTSSGDTSAGAFDIE